MLQDFLCSKVLQFHLIFLIHVWEDVISKCSVFCISTQNKHLHAYGKMLSENKFTSDHINDSFRRWEKCNKSGIITHSREQFLKYLQKLFNLQDSKNHDTEDTKNRSFILCCNIDLCHLCKVRTLIVRSCSELFCWLFQVNNHLWRSPCETHKAIKKWQREK